MLVKHNKEFADDFFAKSLFANPGIYPGASADSRKFGQTVLSSPGRD